MSELVQQLDYAPPALITRSLSAAMTMFAGKWKLSILWHLEQRPRRFGELSALLPGVTAKVLTYQLRDLEGAGLVGRAASSSPRQTEYALTESGHAAIPLLQELWEWGNWYLRRLSSDHCAADETSNRL